jgi:hypothetical protein
VSSVISPPFFSFLRKKSQTLTGTECFVAGGTRSMPFPLKLQPSHLLLLVQIRPPMSRYIIQRQHQRAARTGSVHRGGSDASGSVDLGTYPPSPSYFPLSRTQSSRAPRPLPDRSPSPSKPLAPALAKFELPFSLPLRNSSLPWTVVGV